jgi:hypothetical protein
MSIMFLAKQDKAKELVTKCLEQDIRCRNSDLYLILMVWQRMQHIKCFIPYEEMNKMIKPETITRCRRQIQNTEGRLVATDPVVFNRRNKEKILREYYRK